MLEVDGVVPKSVRRVWTGLPALAAAALAASPLAAQQAEPAGPPDEPVGLPELKDFRLPRERPALPPIETQPAPTPTPPPAQQPEPTPPAAEPAPARPAPAPRTFPRPAPPARQPQQQQPQAPVPTAPPPAETAPIPAEPPPVDTLPVEPQAEAPVPLPASEVEEGDGFNWLYLALAALLGLGIFAALRRRSARERRPEPVATPAPPPAPRPAAAKPTPPPAPAPSPAIAADDEPRPRLQLEFRPARAAATADYTEVQYELIVRNVGALAAENVLLEARMFNAGPELDGELAAFFAAPDPARSLRAPSLPGMTETSVKSTIRMPKESVREINVQGRRIFIPVVAFNLVYHWGEGRSGQTSQSFIVGREPDNASDKMGPFRLDLGPRVYRSVSQRPNKLEHVV